MSEDEEYTRIVEGKFKTGNELTVSTLLKKIEKKEIHTIYDIT